MSVAPEPGGKPVMGEGGAPSPRAMIGKAVRLQMANQRAAGWSVRQIAEAHGCTALEVARVLKKVWQRWDKMEKEAVEEARALELMRCDEFLKALWPSITGVNHDGTPKKWHRGDLSKARAIEVALKISERRAKLRGLDMPTLAYNANLNVGLSSMTEAELNAEAERLGLRPIDLARLPLSLPGEETLVVPEAEPASRVPEEGGGVRPGTAGPDATKDAGEVPARDGVPPA